MGKLFDVLTLLADQGPDCLSWNKEVDNLLFWSLLLKKDHTEKKTFKVLLLNFTIYLTVKEKKMIQIVAKTVLNTLDTYLKNGRKS